MDVKLVKKRKSNLALKIESNAQENDKQQHHHPEIQDRVHYEPLPFLDYSLFEENIDKKWMSIHVNPTNQKKIVFIPRMPIKVQVVAERKASSHLTHSYLYLIIIEHNKHIWQVTRCYKEIKEVHKKLASLVKAELGYSCSNIPTDKIKPDWPIFPLKSDHLLDETRILVRCREISLYLERILTYPPYRDHHAVNYLLSVSHMSFLQSVSPSILEGMLYKKVGENFLGGGCRKSRNCCHLFKFCYRQRWFCIKDTYVVYLNPQLNNSICNVMLVDKEFSCKIRSFLGSIHNSLEIKNSQKSIVLKSKNTSQLKEWYDKLNEMLFHTGRQFNDQMYLNYGSFAPSRKNQLCRWFLNASSYMEQVMNGLNNAKEEIYIADWWLSPEIYLKRPTDDLQYRLDKILIKKAKEGVKIYILLYKEIKFTLNLMSLRTRHILTEYGMNQNIKVLRHPDHFIDGVFMWSHHEKFVIIDQSVAFLGGIDLCFGRWDDEMHRIIDLGKIQNITEINFTPNPMLTLTESQSDTNLLISKTTRPMQYLSKIQQSQQQLSSLIKTSEKANKSLNKQNETDLKMVQAFMYKKEIVKSEDLAPKPNLQLILDKTKENIRKKTTLSRTSTKFTINRTPEKELHRTYSLKKNSFKKEPTVVWISGTKDIKKRSKTPLKNIFKSARNLRMKSDIDDDIYDTWHPNNKVNQSYVDLDEVDLPKNSDIGYQYWIGKDYSNAYREDIKEIQEFATDQFNRTEVPRMPWRDEAAVVIGHSARDLARHFIQRWNQCKHEQVPLIETYPYLIPKSYQEIFKYNHEEWFLPDLYRCETQILRSVDDWSAGISHTETSILKAYCELIKQAEYYIYIENQFFITTTDGSKDTNVKNEIGLALAERIITAHKNNQKFRIYVFLPLLPGFDRINAIKAIQYYNLRSINIGEHSIYKHLKKAGINDPSEYITFHGMRNWSVLMGKLVQEIIYVHSKLMIIDDRYVICGSANINDRSMLGKRDSEVAVLIKDEELIDSFLNDQKVKVGKYAFTLRQKIFKLHLGIYFNNPNLINVNDCVSDTFYHMFKSISIQNTMVYDEVFKCLPSNSILTFSDLKNYSKQASLNKTNPIEGKNKLEKFVMGLVVDFPLAFLSHEKNFFPDFDTPEGFVPTEFWT